MNERCSSIVEAVFCVSELEKATDRALAKWDTQLLLYKMPFGWKIVVGPKLVPHHVDFLRARVCVCVNPSPWCPLGSGEFRLVTKLLMLEYKILPYGCNIIHTHIYMCVLYCNKPLQCMQQGKEGDLCVLSCMRPPTDGVSSESLLSSFLTCYTCADVYWAWTELSALRRSFLPSIIHSTQCIV